LTYIYSHDITKLPF